MRKKIYLGVCALVFFTISALAQTITVTGKVTDTKGATLSGASVLEKGTRNGVSANDDGSFIIKVKTGAILTISSVGYETVQLKAANNLMVKLNTDLDALSEVVVVGYGTKSKKDVTTSVARVSSKEFANLPLPSFEQALQGRAAGVFINSGSGKLGQGLNIRVRGISSISANQQPFVVIDGIPVVNESLGSATEPDNPLASINPDDIESIEVLKDAAQCHLVKCIRCCFCNFFEFDAFHICV